MADSAFLAIAVVFSLGVVVGVLGYIVSRLVTPRRKYPLKFERFEAGNPPHGKARGLFVMQYYAYLIIFLTVEPIVIFFFIIMIDISSSLTSLFLFLIITLSLVPPLIFGFSEAKKVKQWILRKEVFS